MNTDTLTLTGEDDPEYQPLLREAARLARAGRVKHDPLSPELARRIADWRERMCDAHVLWTDQTRAIVLVDPPDGQDLFLMVFDALTFADEQARQ